MTHPANVKRHMPAWVEGMKRAEGGQVTGPSGGDDLSKIRESTLEGRARAASEAGMRHQSDIISAKQTQDDQSNNFKDVP